MSAADEIRGLRREINALRREVGELRRELANHQPVYIPYAPYPYVPWAPIYPGYYMTWGGSTYETYGAGELGNCPTNT